MLASDIPAKFNIPWANAAGGSYVRPIPEASQIGIQDGAASLTDGYPPKTMTPLGAGGTPPWGQDTNGILKQVTQWLQWAQAGGAIKYDATFQVAIGGYPNGATVRSAVTFGLFWVSIVDDNLTDPDAGGAGWVTASSNRTGDLSFGLWTTPLPGWIMCNDGTIGNAISGGTSRANADTVALFTLLWNGVSNTFAPVSTGRGANAAADFAAGKTISLTKMLGRALAISGAGAGLTARALGEYLGQEKVALTGDENGPHVHGQQDETVLNEGSAAFSQASPTYLNSVNGGTTKSSGLGTPHENMPPESFVNAMIHL